MGELGAPAITALQILAVLGLVLANGFFVAAEFSLVAVRPSRVAELVVEGRRNSKALQRAINKLDTYLAATQLGVTISSLALGWIGEPVLAHLVEAVMTDLPWPLSELGAHPVAVALAFIIITVLHIVLGELAPKSLALQRSERTALGIVWPLGLFLLIFRPAIVVLNGLGNGVLRLCGLQTGTGEGSLHSPEELRLLIGESKDAGLLEPAQQEVIERVFSVGERRVGDIMTPRPEIEWINANDTRGEIIGTLRNSRYEQLLVCRGDVNNLVGILSKQDVLVQALDGLPLDVLSLVRPPPLVIPETIPVFKVLEQFRKEPVSLAVVVDEYGNLQGIVSQTVLLEAIAGDLADPGSDTPEIVEIDGGALMIDGMTPALDVFDRIGIHERFRSDHFHTLAGFVLLKIGRMPVVGDHFTWDGWRFEIIAMDRRRIDRIRVSPVDD